MAEVATSATSDQLLVVIDPVARQTDGESVRIVKDVLSAGAATKVCLPDGPEEFARALMRRGSRRPVVVGDDRLTGQGLDDGAAEQVGDLEHLVASPERPRPDEHDHVAALVQHGGGPFQVGRPGQPGRGRIDRGGGRQPSWPNPLIGDLVGRSDLQVVGEGQV